MKNIAFAGTLAAAATAGLIGLAAPAFAAPAESDAQDTISSLQEQGYTVVVTNPNNVALSDATVSGVRQGPEQISSYRDNNHDNWVDETTQSIVFVDVR